MNLIGVYGASGFGSEVVPLVKSQYPGVKLCIIDDAFEGETFQSYPVFCFEEFVSLEGSKSVVLAIADSKIRQKLSHKCNDAGFSELKVQAFNSVVMDNVILGDGAILSPFTTLTSNITIGKSFHANLYSYVAHDCEIGDYVTFAPSVKCNGNVIVEDFAYIGTGAVIKQGTPKRPLVIGKGAVVGMGAVVTKNVAPGVTVIGNPAKPLSKATIKR